MKEANLNRVFAIGNIGIDKIKVGDLPWEEVMGGTLYRTLMVAATLRVANVSAYGSIGASGNGAWEGVKDMLKADPYNIDVAGVYEFQPDAEGNSIVSGIGFEIEYDQNKELKEVTVHGRHGQGISVDTFETRLKRAKRKNEEESFEGDLAYICPMPPEHQSNAAALAKERGMKVAVTTHMNLLQRDGDMETFREMLPNVDVLSLNLKEARMIMGEEFYGEKSIANVGISLSILVGGDAALVYITDGENGIGVYQNGQEIIQEKSSKHVSREEITDVTGAGDIVAAANIFYAYVHGFIGDEQFVGLEYTLSKGLAIAFDLVGEKLGMYGFPDPVPDYEKRILKFDTII